MPSSRQQQAAMYYGSKDRASPDEHSSNEYSRPVTAESRPNSAHPESVRQPNGPGYAYARSNSTTDNTYAEPAPATHFAESKSYNFIASAGQAPKRPRRRYDEIERLYTCDYPGCSKAYGTLNHLNSHKTMQKHGPKSTPAQFKELRKAWRDSKKAAAAATRPRPVPDTMYMATRSPPLRRPVTASADFAYHVPNPFATNSTSSYSPSASTSGGVPSHFGLGQPSNGWGGDGNGLHSPYDQNSYGQQPISPHRAVTAPSYLANPPLFGFSTQNFNNGGNFSAAMHPSSSGGVGSSGSGDRGGPQVLRRASLPGTSSGAGFYAGGDDAFAIIPEEAQYAPNEDVELEGEKDDGDAEYNSDDE